MAACVEMENLTKYYGKKLGVTGLTFDVIPGEVVGFLGPNGSGKTTGLRMLVGLLKITSGSARLFGTDVATATPAIRKRIGYLPGTLTLHKNMSVREYFEFLGAMRTMDCRRSYETLSERFGLALDRDIASLSKGTRQKVGVVQAFMHSPDLLILDEPTSGLDPFMQREFDDLLDESKQRGAAVLLSSHVMSEVERLASRVAIIDKGKLVVVEQVDRLKLRATRTLDLEFAQPVDAARFRSLPGVSDAEARDKRVTVTMSGSENAVLSLAADLGVVTLHSHDPSLDEIFVDLVNESGR